VKTKQIRMYVLVCKQQRYVNDTTPSVNYEFFRKGFPHKVP